MGNLIHSVKTKSIAKEVLINTEIERRIPLSTFTLFFNDELMNINYNTINLKAAFSILFISILFLLSLSAFILILIPCTNKAYEIVSAFSFGINAFFLLMYILLKFKPKLFKCKDPKLIELSILYEQYTMMTLTNCLLQYHLKEYYQFKYASFGLLIEDLIFKYVWAMTPLNEFILFFSCNIISIVIVIPFYIWDGQDTICLLMVYIIFIIILTTISFNFTKSSKVIYCLMKMAHSGFNFLEVINTGFASVSYKGSVSYSNAFFDNESIDDTFNGRLSNKEDLILQLINGSYEEMNEDLRKAINEQINLPLNFEILNKTVKSPDNSGERNDLNNNIKVRQTGASLSKDLINNSNQIIFDVYSRQRSNESLLQLIIRHSQLNKAQFDTFTYLGKKKLVNEKERKNLSLKIFFRNNYESNCLEFIFNDESKENYQYFLKLFSQQINEYLHDFKNPLITLNEDLSEIQDTFNDLKKNKMNEFKFDDAFIDQIDFLTLTTSDCMDMISSFSHYLKNIMIRTDDIELKMETFDLMGLLDYIDYFMKNKIKKHNKFIEFKILQKLEGNIQLHSDKTKLKQLLVNLLSNSFKFTTIGHIILKVQREEVKHKQYIRFEVEDSGYGMEKKIQDSIFQPFATYNPNNLNKEGCGLGLVISKKISEKLGIGLQMDSCPQKGTKMWFYCEEKEILEDQPKSNPKNNTCPFQNQELNIVSKINTTPSNQVSSPLEPLIQLQRRKSHLSKLKIIKEEPMTFDNNNDTIYCENPLSISPHQKMDHSTPSPKKKRIKYSLDLINKSPMKFREQLDDNFELSSSRILSNFNLVECKAEEFIIKSDSLQKNNTFYRYKRGATLFQERDSYLFNQNKSRTKTYGEDKLHESANPSCTILIVDDEESIRKGLKRVIREISKTITIHETEDGLDVLCKFLEFETSSYEWIIIDDEMNFLNGTALVTALEFFCESSIFRKCKFDNTILKRIIIMTSNKDCAKYKLANKDIKILSKPVKREVVMKLLNKC